MNTSQPGRPILKEIDGSTAVAEEGPCGHAVAAAVYAAHNDRASPVHPGLVPHTHHRTGCFVCALPTPNLFHVCSQNLTVKTRQTSCGAGSHSKVGVSYPEAYGRRQVRELPASGVKGARRWCGRFVCCGDGGALVETKHVALKKEGRRKRHGTRSGGDEDKVMANASQQRIRYAGNVHPPVSCGVRVLDAFLRKI